MRYECDEPGYEQNYVEFSRAWTRKERRDYFDVQGEEWLLMVGRKIVACHLDCVDGPPVTSGADLTMEAADERIDAIVWEWFKASLLSFYNEMSQLGNALRLRSSPIFVRVIEEQAKKMATETTPEPPAAANSQTS